MSRHTSAPRAVTRGDLLALSWAVVLVAVAVVVTAAAVLMSQLGAGL